MIFRQLYQQYIEQVTNFVSLLRSGLALCAWGRWIHHQSHVVHWRQLNSLEKSLRKRSQVLAGRAAARKRKWESYWKHFATHVAL